MLLIKILLFTLIVPGTVGVYLPVMLAGQSQPELGLHPWLALPVLLVGLAIYSWCVWDFARFGLATPMPLDPPKRLVIRGLYHYVRNPMYIGVLTVIVGWAIWFGLVSLLFYTGVVWLSFHVFIIMYEEPALRRKFGQEYVAYRSRVYRWLPSLA